MQRTPVHALVYGENRAARQMSRENARVPAAAIRSPADAHNARGGAHARASPAPWTHARVGSQKTGTMYGNNQAGERAVRRLGAASETAPNFAFFALAAGEKTGSRIAAALHARLRRGARTRRLLLHRLRLRPSGNVCRPH